MRAWAVMALFATALVACAASVGEDGAPCGATVCVTVDAAPSDAPGAMLRDTGAPDGPGAAPLGSSCTSAAQCQSTFCAQGICCSSACSGTCESCGVPGNEGTCVATPSGQRHAACTAEPVSTCGRDGTCDGGRRCRLAVMGTMCAQATCSAGIVTAASTCDGSGRCVSGAKTSCPTGRCSGAAGCAGNAAPVVNAGADVKKYTLLTELRLMGSVTDDGFPTTPGRVTVVWSKVSGPGAAAFVRADSTGSPVRFSEPGRYVLRLTANDGELTSSDDVTVDVFGLDQGLLGLWRFDDATGTVAADASGGGNAGALSGATFTTDGRAGGAVDFAGDGDRVTIAHATNGRLDFGPSDFSISLWVKVVRSSNGSTPPKILSKVEQPAQGARIGWELSQTTAAPRVTTFRFGNASASVELSAGTLSETAWHHLAVVRRGNRFELHLNGAMQTFKQQNIDSSDTQAPVLIGATATGSMDFDGRVDDLRLYNRALSDDELKILAGGTSP